MTLTAALVGGGIGMGSHMLNNAARKIPLSRYPWAHVGLFIGGAYLGVQYEEWEKRQVEDINEMRADRGMPPVLHTDAFYSLESKNLVAEENATKKKKESPFVGENQLGQFFKWMNSELKLASQFKKDNEVGTLEYDEEDMAQRKTAFTQQFFRTVSEREDYDDDVRALCKKLSTQTKWGAADAGLTLEEIRSMRKRFAQKRIAKMVPVDEEQAARNKQIVQDRKINPVPDIDISKFPEDLQEEMRSTGNHIKLVEYLREKVAAFERMSYEEQKAHMRSLIKTQKKWASMTIEQKLRYSFEDFDDLPYEDQKKYRKQMQDAEKFSLPFFALNNSDSELKSSEEFLALEKKALKRQNEIAELLKS